MKKVISCEFNIDNASIEVKYSDGTMLSIYTPAVDATLDITMKQQTEVDWLIYNKPLEYVQLVLGGNWERYLQGTPEHRLMD